MRTGSLVLRLFCLVVLLGARQASAVSVFGCIKTLSGKIFAKVNAHENVPVEPYKVHSYDAKIVKADRELPASVTYDSQIDLKVRQLADHDDLYLPPDPLGQNAEANQAIRAINLQGYQNRADELRKIVARIRKNEMGKFSEDTYLVHGSPSDVKYFDVNFNADAKNVRESTGTSGSGIYTFWAGAQRTSQGGHRFNYKFKIPAGATVLDLDQPDVEAADKLIRELWSQDAIRFGGNSDAANTRYRNILIELVGNPDVVMNPIPYRGDGAAHGELPEYVIRNQQFANHFTAPTRDELGLPDLDVIMGNKPKAKK